MSDKFITTPKETTEMNSSMKVKSKKKVSKDERYKHCNVYSRIVQSN